MNPIIYFWKVVINKTLLWNIEALNIVTYIFWMFKAQNSVEKKMNREDLINVNNVCGFD